MENLREREVKQFLQGPRLCVQRAGTRGLELPALDLLSRL